MTTTFQIGRIPLTCVEESALAVLDPFEVYPDATEAALAAELDWLAPRFYDRDAKKLVLSFQGFLLRSAGKLILVDTCVGDCKHRKRPAFNDQRWGWLAKLEAAGAKPEDVDFVVMTHCHVDHIGWNTRLEDGRWVPTFPNARYLIARDEWAFWSGEAGRIAVERSGDYIADSLLPVMEAGLVDLVAMDHRIDGDIALAPAAGHTPGCVVVDIRSGGERAVLLGDVLHTPLQIRHPDWSARFCTDPIASRATRRRLLDELADTGTLALPSHFPSPTAGWISRAGDGYVYRFAGEDTPIPHYRAGR